MAVNAHAARMDKAADAAGGESSHQITRRMNVHLLEYLRRSTNIEVSARQVKHRVDTGCYRRDACDIADVDLLVASAIKAPMRWHGSVVKCVYLIPEHGQPPNQVRPDETGSACDHNRLPSRVRHVGFLAATATA